MYACNQNAVAYGLVGGRVATVLSYRFISLHGSSSKLATHPLTKNRSEPRGNSNSGAAWAYMEGEKAYALTSLHPAGWPRLSIRSVNAEASPGGLTSSTGPSFATLCPPVYL